jgi:hypothetical protein
LTNFALLPWADAHPFISTSVKPRVNADDPNSNQGLARTTKSREKSEP